MKWLTDKVGNEFGSVEALWSQFEHFMGREGQGQGQAQGTGQGASPETQGQGQSQSHEGQEEGQSKLQDVGEEELWMFIRVDMSYEQCLLIYWYLISSFLSIFITQHT